MYKDKVISGVLMLIILFKLFDLYIDFSHQVELYHIIQEFILIILSLGMFIYLTLDIRQRSKQAQLLSEQLKVSRDKFQDLSQQVIASKKSFFEAIDKQFDIWEFTKTEKEVALLLVKGLSNYEIAEVRSKSPKTVSHQASSIYKKANVNGRHELAALFFEELIN